MIGRRMLMSGGPKVLAFVASVRSNNNASTYTFTSAAVGTPAGDRRNIIAVHAQNGTGNISNVTVGGDGWTAIQDVLNVSCICGLGILLNPAQTTEDIVVTFSQSHLSAGIGVWESTGLTTDNNVDSDNSTAAAPTATLTTVVGGFVVGATTNVVGSSSSWSGTGVTERYDDQDADAHDQSGADASNITGTSLTITNTITGNDRQVGVFASF